MLFTPVQFEFTLAEVQENPDLLENHSVAAVAAESMELSEGVWLDIFGYTRDGEEIWASYEYDPVSEEMWAIPTLIPEYLFK